MVKCAKKCYLEYPTPVNLLKESGITYDNTPLEYARMDNKFARSKRGIGESSNLAQLALTYYWTEKAQEHPDPQRLKDLYDNFIILATLAQVVIDGCKREYEVDALAEIDRIKKMDCMIMKNGNRRADFPEFMRYTKSIPTTKSGNELPYAEIKEKRDKLKNRINENLICPMNDLQKSLNKIQGATNEKSEPMEKYFVKINERASNRQMSKIRKLVREYNDFIKLNHDRLFDEDFSDEFELITNEFMRSINKIKIGLGTMNRLIETALSLDGANNNPDCKKHLGAKYVRRLLNTLYLSCETADGKHDKFFKNFVCCDKIA